MIPRVTTAVILLGSLLGLGAFADTQKASTAASGVQPMTRETRMMIIRDLNAEHVFARTFFPFGEKRLALKNCKPDPGPQKIQPLIADHGPAAKPADRIMITTVDI